MKCRKGEKWFQLFVCASFLGLPVVTFADATDIAKYPRKSESNIEIEYFSVGGSKSNTSNAQAAASGVIVQTEYEKNDMVFSFNFERWDYKWSNPENLPFISGSTGVPWSSFNTLQFGLAYEQEINNQWEVNYYVEAESSFEKEISNSKEFETGLDVIYDWSENWAYTLNFNLEYLDASETELGMDFEIEWNHDRKDGWSGEFEISSEFPETSLTYHYTPAISTTMFLNESGTSTIRLADSTPVIGMRGGYFEDEYNSIGMKIDYEFAHESYLTFSLQQNTNRRLSFTDRTGIESSYEFSDSMESSIGLLYTF